MKKLRIFVLNVLLMSATTLLMRTIALSFNIYLSARLGSAGMGLFTLVSSVYGFAATFALSGVNLASTRLTAQALGRESGAEARSAMLRCMLYGAAFGLAAALGLFGLARPIGEGLLGDARTVDSLRILALSLPFSAAASALSGYFNAVQRSGKSASAQILSQLLRIGASALLMTLLHDGLENGCFAVSAGIALSECFCCAYLYLLYRGDLKKHISKLGAIAPALTRTLFATAMPVALSTYVRSGLVTVEHLLIPRGLRLAGGNTESALAGYGVFCGMVMPVILYPMAFLSAAAGMLIPEIAAEEVVGRERHIGYIVSRSYQITLLFSIGCAGIMLCFSHELGSVLYGSDEAASYIRMMAPLIPVMYADHITDGLLKGLGEQLYVMKVNILDASLSCLLVWLLLPHTGIKGYIFIVYLTEILNTALSVCRLLNRVDYRPALLRNLLLPLLSIILSASAVRIFFEAGRLYFRSQALEMVIHMLCTLVGYLALLIVTRSLSREDLRWLGGMLRRGDASESNKKEPSSRRKRTPAAQAGQSSM